MCDSLHFQVFNRTWTMKRLCHFAVALIFLNLVACGGGDDGGSSDGAGSASGSSQSANSADLAKFAGTYTGTITATANVDGKSETLSRQITFVVSENGDTISVQGEAFPLTSQNFEITVPLQITNGDINCIFLDAIFKGTISEDQISGTISGTTECLVGGTKKVPGEISGYSGATRI